MWRELVVVCLRSYPLPSFLPSLLPSTFFLFLPHPFPTHPLPPCPVVSHRGSYCDITAKAGLLPPADEILWKRATLQVPPVALSPTKGGRVGLLAVEATGAGNATSPSSPAAGSPSVRSEDLHSVGRLEESTGPGPSVALLRLEEDDGSVIQGKDVDDDDDVSELTDRVVEAPLVVVESSVPTHVTFGAPAPLTSPDASGDAILHFQQMLTAEWYTNLGLGEPPFTTVTPSRTACNDFLWFTPVGAG